MGLDLVGTEPTADNAGDAVQPWLTTKRCRSDALGPRRPGERAGYHPRIGGAHTPRATLSRSYGEPPRGVWLEGSPRLRVTTVDEPESIGYYGYVQ